MFSGKNDPKTVINDLQVASNDLNLAKTEGSPPKRDEFIKIGPNYEGYVQMFYLFCVPSEKGQYSLYHWNRV